MAALPRLVLDPRDPDLLVLREDSVVPPPLVPPVPDPRDLDSLDLRAHRVPRPVPPLEPARAHQFPRVPVLRAPDSPAPSSLLSSPASPHPSRPEEPAARPAPLQPLKPKSPWQTV